MPQHFIQHNDTVTVDELLYEFGYYPPRYPVPAIILNAYIPALPASDPFAGPGIRQEGWLIYKVYGDGEVFRASIEDYGNIEEREAFAMRDW